MRFSIVIAAVAALSLSACAGAGQIVDNLSGGGAGGVQSSLDQLGQFTLADIANADVIAVANNDQLAHQCFASGHGLNKLITDQQAAIGGAANLTVTGAISAFEAGRVTVLNGKAIIANGVPPYLLQDCAPLVAAVKLDAADFLAKLATFGIKP